MKQLNEEMIAKIKVASISGVIILLFYFGLLNLSQISYFITNIISVLTPFISGFALAFILEPLVLLIKKLLKNKFTDNTRKNIAVILTMIIFITTISLFLIVIIPQLFHSIVTIGEIISNGLSNIDQTVANISKSLGVDFAEFNEFFDLFGWADALMNIMSYVGNYLPDIVEGGVRFISTLFSLLIGVIICVYLLLDKEKFYRQIKSTMYAFLPKDKVEYLIDITCISSSMFKNFFIGKFIDSLIVGIICYVCMKIFGFEYALLISFIIGITNIIPVFGPFIGAIPSVVILLFVDPIEAFWFILFILALQQFDGNILGPYILGDSIGLPSFWVMFAIIVGGKLFGLIGMFLGIPLFAVLYYLIKAAVYKRLEEKNIEI